MAMGRPVRRPLHCYGQEVVALAQHRGGGGILQTFRR